MFDRKEFKAQLARREMSMSDLAIKIGIHPATMFRKVERDGDFTREEIAKIADCLDIEDPSEIFFAEELT